MLSLPIALVGLSGAGKSTVGRTLAACLAAPLLDTDALIISRAGRSIPDIFAHDGEAYFRDLEHEALAVALAGSPSVVATGAGIVLRPENRQLLRERSLVVWLDAPTNALIARLHAHDERRPLLEVADPGARLDALRLARAGFYQEVAHLHLLTANQTVEAITERICQEYQQIHSSHMR